MPLPEALLGGREYDIECGRETPAREPGLDAEDILILVGYGVY